MDSKSKLVTFGRRAVVCPNETAERVNMKKLVAVAVVVVFGVLGIGCSPAKHTPGADNGSLDDGVSPAVVTSMIVTEAMKKISQHSELSERIQGMNVQLNDYQGTVTFNLAGEGPAVHVYDCFCVYPDGGAAYAVCSESD